MIQLETSGRTNALHCVKGQYCHNKMFQYLPAGLDFKEHFLRIKPHFLVVTEDDKYGDVKQQLCAQASAAAAVHDEIPTHSGKHPPQMMVSSDILRSKHRSTYIAVSG